MNITHTKVFEPKKQAKIPPLPTKKRKLKKMRNLASDPDLLLPLVFFLLWGV
jgi:hypothetical protein